MSAKDLLTRTEAEQRAADITDVSYSLDLELEAGAKTYRGDCTVSFSGRGDNTFLEFIGGTIERLEVNDRPTEPDWDGTRLKLPDDFLADRNTVRLVYENPYDHSGEGFHQFFDPEDGAEYLYTQFEPYSAHRLLPCFDQPDIKATYELSVLAPSEWEVISAGRMMDAEPTSGGRTLRRFEQTLPFSTYLLSVVAGPLTSVTDSHGDIPLGLYCRASVAEHLDADVLFAETKAGMDTFADFFGRAYPFTKYDQVFVPEFNWGGMENVGAVTYTDSLLFRDPPTSDQLLRRAEILLHELAHMWFGDLVTMKWWDDLWLNESFATFIAYLAMDRAGSYEGLWLDFNTRNKLVAYRDDQLPTTHPIVDDIADTNGVFLNFDQITYGKGASVLRQLVEHIGLDGFLAGLRTYFARHEFGNTTLVQFLAALQEGSGTDLAGWASRWLTTANVNTLSAEWELQGDFLAKLVLHQRAPEHYPTLRPHTVEVAVLSEGASGLALNSVRGVIERERAPIAEAVALPRPVLVFPNYRDLAYTKVALDPVSLDFVRTELSRLDDPLLRLQIWQSLWEMVRDRELASLDYLELVRGHLAAEDNIQIIRPVTATAGASLAAYVPETVKRSEIHEFVALCRRALDAVPEGDARVLWARALVGAATELVDLALAGEIVDETEGISGLSIDQDMRWSVAVRWSAMDMPGAAERVATERDRDPSDRGVRASLRAEVSRPDPDVKAEAWRRIHEKGYESLHLAASAMVGFRWWTQRELLDPYATEFFGRVATVFDDWEFEAAKAYFGGLYPAYRIEFATVERTRDLLDVGGDPRLQRLAREAIDEMERAMACRELAAAAPVDEAGPEASEVEG
jgi:aminopeptidase N